MLQPSGDDFPLSKFTINPSTGLIQTTSNSLDRETKDSYVLVVSATDDGTPSNTVSMHMPSSTVLSTACIMVAVMR